jgi:hypothetical protein
MFNYYSNFEYKYEPRSVNNLQKPPKIVTEGGLKLNLNEANLNISGSQYKIRRSGRQNQHKKQL